MILPDCNDFPRSGRLIGIDWGARRIGVAISDDSRELVFVRTPILVGRDRAFVGRQIADMAVSERAVGIVIGRPIHADGTESETMAKVRECATEIAKYTDLPILFVDEDLTSIVAQEEMGRVRQADIKRELDSWSARIILENAIALLRRV